MTLAQFNTEVNYLEPKQNNRAGELAQWLRALAPPQRSRVQFPAHNLP